MTTILIQDPLRASVEAQSGGLQTVLYTPKKQPVYMNIIPKANIEDLYPNLGITGTHPAFLKGGKTLSQLFCGTYPGRYQNGELISIPNAYPSGNELTPNMMLAALRTQGSNWHITSSMERSLLLGLQLKSGKPLLGPNDWGRSGNDPTQFGRRLDGLPVGTQSGNKMIFTGSGPQSFRLGQVYTGISDLVSGQNYEHVLGLRIVAGGEIQFYYGGSGGNAAATNTNGIFDDTSLDSGWKAFDATTGALITPTYTGTMAAGNYQSTTPNSIKVVANQSDANDATKIYYQPWGNIANTAYPFVNQLPQAVLNILDLHGAIPTQSLKSLLNGSETFNQGNAAATGTSALHMAMGVNGLAMAGFAVQSNVFNTQIQYRPWYYNTSDLS